MAGASDALEHIRAYLTRRQLNFTHHAATGVLELDIAPRDIEEALKEQTAELLEDYAKDARGSSCLILVWTRDGRPLHVVCSYPQAVVVTVYQPDPGRWEDFRRRLPK
ncbi:MAG: DUF4258 domain-containing protein [Chloroflexi bacterium]|nr:DUF4258 domain-containing protein [Chloroflexota bacterium]